MKDIKYNLRKAMMEKRDAIEESTRHMYDKKIFERLTGSAFYNSADLIFIYVSFRSEADTHDIIRNSLECGKRICVPKVNKETKEMEAYIIESMDQLKKGYFNILEPYDGCKKADLEDIDLVLMPGMAFDRKGGRIGYGGGFYDRFLMSMKRKVNRIALAYHFQVVDEVPVDWMDIRIDGIITDEEIIDISII